MPAVTDFPSLKHLHPITALWFQQTFGQPTEIQSLAWPAIASGGHSLIAAPTGSGKTLSAFLVSIDRLLRLALDNKLKNQTRIVYISPLKALSNDIHLNLEKPLAAITALAEQQGYTIKPITAAVRSGDSTNAERLSLLKRPPHILVTTPESLYLLLTAHKGRDLLSSVDTVIIDEIHALARDKRGAHLSLSLQRLELLTRQPLQRIGLSATQKPIEDIAAYLVGQKQDENGHWQQPACRILQTTQRRVFDLAVEIPPSPLQAICSHDQWAEVIARLADLVKQHRSTLIFVNTRRMAERVAYLLREHFAEDAVASHHGSLSKDMRLSAERRLKSGQLQALVATASLELGIDIGAVDLVCQIGSPRSIATFLQRVGRACHQVGGIPKGRLFALTRDELIEMAGLLDAVHHGELDAIEIPRQPLDILAQQIIAETSAQSYPYEQIYDWAKGSYNYRNLELQDFDAVIATLREGYAKGQRTRAQIMHDPVNNHIKGKLSARLNALTNGGAIPELGDLPVITIDEGLRVGTVSEDFAIESSAGDIFVLGTHSWQLVGLRNGQVLVRDVGQAPPTIPVWFGEAPGRSFELSQAVSNVRKKLAELLPLEQLMAQLPQLDDDLLVVLKNMPPLYQNAVDWLINDIGLDTYAAGQLVHYCACQIAALQVMPTMETVVFERFFDDSGGMQLVIHCPYGIRINRAIGLSMRKRFCVSYNFELQAAADDNGIVLSLGPQHSFPLESLYGMVNDTNMTAALRQAILPLPMFEVRWRWTCNRALAVARNHHGKRVPPALQRFRADDLLTQIFPEQTGCQENIVGDLPIPDHPMVNQTIDDCFHEAMDVERAKQFYRDYKAGKIAFIGFDTREPSPFSYQLLNSNPYSFLDDAPLEERRSRVTPGRQRLEIQQTQRLASISEDVIAQVKKERWPNPGSLDHLYDILVNMVALPEPAAQPWLPLLLELQQSGRAFTYSLQADHDSKSIVRFWAAAESLPALRSLFANGSSSASFTLPQWIKQDISKEEACMSLLQGLVGYRAAMKLTEIQQWYPLPDDVLLSALYRLENRGIVMQEKLFAHDPGPYWVSRPAFMQMHSLAKKQRLPDFSPVPPHIYWQTLLEDHLQLPERRRASYDSVIDVVQKLQGYEAPLSLWEEEFLPLRLPDYDRGLLDQLSLSGHVQWARLTRPHTTDDTVSFQAKLNKKSPLTMYTRESFIWLSAFAGIADLPPLQEKTQQVYQAIQQRGAVFSEDLQQTLKLLPVESEEQFLILANLGLIHADGFGVLRSLYMDKNAREKALRHKGPGMALLGMQLRGRWSAVAPTIRPSIVEQQPVEALKVDDFEMILPWCHQLLKRWGVVCYDIVSAKERLSPPWALLQRGLRLLEARGDILTGRFIQGLSGEQFIDKVFFERLKRTATSSVKSSAQADSQIQREQKDDDWLVVHSADPLNMTEVFPTLGANFGKITSGVLMVKGGMVVAVQDQMQIEYADNGKPADIHQATVERALRLKGSRREFWLQTQRTN